MTRSAQEEQPTKRMPSRRSKKIQITTVINCSNDEKFLQLKEKNRESAQRSRDNKKRYVMNLQAKISQLQLENDYLRKQLSLCHCPRTEDAPDNTAAVSEQEPKIIEEESPEASFFERVSVRSFTSCSNFLILSLIALFCIFGMVDVTGDSHRPHGGLYSYDHVITAYAKWDATTGSCQKSQAPMPSRLNHIEGRPSTHMPNSTTPIEIDYGERLIRKSNETDPVRLSLNASGLIRSK